MDAARGKGVRSIFRQHRRVGIRKPDRRKIDQTPESGARCQSDADALCSEAENPVLRTGAMANFDWQLGIVIGCIAAAAAFVARRAWRLIRPSGSGAKREGCGTCGACPTTDASVGVTGGGFVPLESLTSRK